MGWLGEDGGVEPEKEEHLVDFTLLQVLSE